MVLLDTRFGLVPPLGEVLSPYRGLWWRPTPLFETHTKKHDLKIDGLKAKVVIKVDHDQITHIFAENDHDLYFAQGYLLASQRLWQMEFLLRTGSGRLSEVFGEKTLEFDRFFRKMGIAQAANQSAALMMEDAVTGPPLTAYTNGVNAYIATLTEKTLPFEYKLLGHKPEQWKVENAAALLKFMAWNLSGFSRDIALTR
ncbi:MAG TPA: penicillin acylase family protein, partial [Bdellovibrionales bacterium]|nr:penicillin acylase family protein [Bdellovibrionales bacterium]